MVEHSQMREETRTRHFPRIGQNTGTQNRMPRVPRDHSYPIDKRRHVDQMFYVARCLTRVRRCGPLA